jgi:hypothetical protein
MEIDAEVCDTKMETENRFDEEIARKRDKKLREEKITLGGTRALRSSNTRELKTPQCTPQRREPTPVRAKS